MPNHINEATRKKAKSARELVSKGLSVRDALKETGISASQYYNNAERDENVLNKTNEVVEELDLDGFQPDPDFSIEKAIEEAKTIMQLAIYVAKQNPQPGAVKSVETSFRVYLELLDALENRRLGSENKAKYDNIIEFIAELRKSEYVTAEKICMDDEHIILRYGKITHECTYYPSDKERLQNGDVFNVNIISDKIEVIK